MFRKVTYVIVGLILVGLLSAGEVRTARGAPTCTAACYVNATTGNDTNAGDQANPLKTIQAGIDAVSPGGTVYVYPGAYSETASNRFLFDGTGPYQFGLFIGQNKSNVTIQGVDVSGQPITAYANVAATVETNATNNFGTSGIFVEADGVTIGGLKILPNAPAGSSDKTIEVIGDAFTLKNSDLADPDGSLYFDDWRYNTTTNTSHVQSYTIQGNLFEGLQIALASGAGYSGPASGRTITGNVFDLQNNTYPAISFNGSGTGVPWFVYSVGGAVIKTNTFKNGGAQYIRARGTYDNSQFDWASYWNDNTYDKAVVVGPNPPGTLTPYTYTSSSYTFANTRHIATTIQSEVDNGNAGDTVLVHAGTYSELVTVNKTLTLKGAQAGVSGVGRCNATAGESIMNGTGGAFYVTANNVVIDGFVVEGATASYLGTGIYMTGSQSGGQVLNNVIRNNIFGLYLNGNGSSATPSSLTLASQNCFANNNQPGAASGNGIYSDQGLTYARIDGNYFTGHRNAGILLTGVVSNAVKDVTISNNRLINDNRIRLTYATNVTVSGNTITGSAVHGVQLAGATSNITISGNTISNAAYAAIRIFDSDGVGPNTTSTVSSNTILDNTYGIVIADPSALSEITKNSIYGTTQGLGIDLSLTSAFPPDGVTPNDSQDPDAGPNQLQNYPVLSEATSDGTQTTVTGSLNSTPSTNFRIEFFANPTPGMSNYGEGKTYLGFVNVTTNASGDATFTATGLSGVPVGQYVSTTATNTTALHPFTSEFSADVQVQTPPPPPPPPPHPHLIQSGSTYYQVPVLGAIGNTKSGVDWVIEAQNLGSTWTKVALLLFAENSGFCQPQAQNPFKIECSGMLKPGTSWVWTASQLPASAKSAIAISYNPSADSGNPYWRCEDWTNTLNKLSWPEGWPSVNPLPGQFPFNWNPFYGEPIGIEVTRRGPGNSNPSLTMASSYSAVSAKGDGRYDPLFGGFAYYAPTVYSGFNGWNSWLYIQNSGSECTSVELWFKAQDDCLRSQICSVAQLSPGYTAQFNVSGCVPTGFTGSAWIRASQPLGIIVDQIGQDVLMSYTGSPGSLCYIFNGQCLDLQGGSTVAYGPLIYRETNGWGTNIHVQNMSGVTAAKVKVYFMDQSGDIITTLVDWVCPRGETSFPLTLVSNLPGNYVGAVRVESQAWQSPGDPNVNASPIAAVAELLNYSSPTKITQAAAYNLFPQEQTYLWQIGAGDASGLESGVGLIGIPSLMQRGNSLNLVTDLAIQNVVPKPGFTDFVVYVYDQNGLIDYVCEKLNEKQVEYVNLDNWDWIRPGFVGSAVISAVYWEHDVLTGVPIFGPSNPQLPILLRNVVGLAAVKVERVIPSTSGPGLVGDLSTASEGFPMPPGFDFEGYTPQCPGVPTSCGSAPLNITICEPVYGQAVVTVVDDSTGAQAFQGIPDANGVVAVPAVLTGRTYKITVADPGKDYVTYTGQGYTARVPAISAVILAPCQSSTPAVPYSVSLTPPTGVVEGYEFLGRTPTGVTNNNGVWSGAPQNPAAGVQLQLWLAPTAANQPGTYLQTTMTNTEGYFKFSNLNPCLLYELKFTGDNAVVVIPGVAATIAGQKYMVSATAGIYPPGPLPLP
ncbi:MAG: right-handed parallel beta-helix repeat-containing protein [Anaerolineae bacterium]